MPTFFMHNFGCRATHADAAAIRADLLHQDFSQIEDSSAADYVVLNTCTVTAAADAEAREMIRRIHRANPRAQVLVTGCYAQRAPDELAQMEGVRWVIGNSHQHDVGATLKQATQSAPTPDEQVFRPFVQVLRAEAKQWPLQSLGLHLASDDTRTRPVLKIQDGCNHRCAYCVIPSVRGRSRSLPAEQVLAGVRALVSSSAKEIVLSGIDLGSYGRDFLPRISLHNLIRRVLKETSVEQLRLSSIEPMDVTADLVEFVAGEPRLAPHFHMPLQSGCDRILHRMHRWYRTAHYSRRVEIIREQLPHAAIGADVIAGFPGESEDDFEQTLQFIAGLPLSYLHVFSFSPRPGTEAERLDERVSENVIHERARRLRNLGEQKLAAFRAAQRDRRMRVLTLNRQGENWTSAISGNYLKVRVEGRRPANQWLEVIFDERVSRLALQAATAANLLKSPVPAPDCRCA